MGESGKETIDIGLKVGDKIPEFVLPPREKKAEYARSFGKSEKIDIVEMANNIRATLASPSPKY